MLRASGGAVHYGTPRPALGAPGFGASCIGRGAINGSAGQRLRGARPACMHARCEPGGPGLPA
eukprot:9408737-Alexandrium_andersonii.AAC.1